MKIIGFILLVALALGLSLQPAEANGKNGGHSTGCNVIQTADADALATTNSFMARKPTVASNTFVGSGPYPPNVYVEIDFQLFEGATGYECTFNVPMTYYDSSGNVIDGSGSVASCTGGPDFPPVCNPDID